MRRVGATLVTLALLLVLTGCGNDTTQSRDASVGRPRGAIMGPYLFDIRGVIRSLRAQGITARRTSGTAVGAKSLPAPSASAAFKADGTPFTLLVFPSEDLANDATESLDPRVDGDVVLGRNILAVVAPRGRGYDRVRGAIGSLGENPPGPEPRFPARGEPPS